MPCTNCTPPLPVASFVFSSAAPCTNCDGIECPQGVISSKCVYNDGPPLLCIGAEENERLNSILQKIDAILCNSSSSNPFPSYNTYCLGPMANEQQFVETISQQFCTLQGSFTNFSTVTYPAGIANLQQQIDDLNDLNLSSCDGIGFSAGDTISVAITKVANFACNIESSLDVSTVEWDLCAVVDPIPTTIQEGFDFVMNQICNIVASNPGALPTFDNTGTCLDTPTTTDSLVNTILKIRSKVCAAPAFNPGTYTPGCISVSGASTLDNVLQELITQLSSVMTDLPRVFDPAYFTVSPVNVGNLCLGKQITLTGPIGGTDRLVAIDNADATPGTLSAKLIAGTGIDLDIVTNPGTMIVSIDPSAANDEKVKTSVADPTAGYLEDKITGFTDVVSVLTNTVSNQVQVSASVNYSLLVERIIDAIENDEDLKTAFCSLVASCPSPCNAPANITVTYVP